MLGLFSVRKMINNPLVTALMLAVCGCDCTDAGCVGDCTDAGCVGDCTDAECVWVTVLTLGVWV